MAGTMRTRLALAAAAAVVLGGSWFLYSRLEQAVIAADRQVQQLSRRLREAQAASEALDEVKRQVAAAEGDLASQLARIPPAESIQGRLLEELANLATRERIIVRKFAYQPQEKQGGFLAVRVSVSVLGDYRNVMDWVRAVETLPYLIRFETMKIKREPPAKEHGADKPLSRDLPVELSLGFAIYVQPSERGEAAAFPNPTLQR